MQLISSSISNIAPNSGDVGNFDFNNLQAENLKAPSANFNPHIPTSGHSTPTPYSIGFGSYFAPSNVGARISASNDSGLPFSTSFDFGSSFASFVGTVPLDLTPASLATFPSFLTAPKTDNSSNPIYPVFPLTPSGERGNFFGQSLGSYDTQLTPSHTINRTPLAGCLSPGSHLLTPSVMTTHFDHVSDIVAHQLYSDSSISSGQQVSTTLVGTTELIKQNEDSITMPLTPSPYSMEGVLVGRTRHGAPGPQQLQRCSPSGGRAGIKREKKRRVVGGIDSTFALDNVRPAKPYKCPVEGCVKSYRRNEHVKRHIKR